MPGATTPWQPPVRDAAFHELATQCRARGLHLWSARSFSEAQRMGADYWLANSTAPKHQAIKEADSLVELRAWLRIPEPAEVQQ